MEPIIAYCGMPKDCQYGNPEHGLISGPLTTWDGHKIGRFVVKSAQTRPDYWRGDRLYAIAATVEGIHYYGRTFGEGSSVVLRPYKRQS